MRNAPTGTRVHILSRSERWLVYDFEGEEALAVIINSNGDTTEEAERRIEALKKTVRLLERKVASDLQSSTEESSE